MKRFILALVLLLALAPTVARSQGQLPYYQSPSIEIIGSGTAADDQPVPASDVSRFRWLSVQLKGTWTGTVTFETSNDGSTWVSAALLGVGSTSGTPVTTTTSNGIFHGPVAAHYFRARFSTASSGTVTGVADFYTTATGMQSKAGATSGTMTGLTADSGGTTTGATPTIAGGAGIVTSRSADTVTVATASSEANFLSAGALTCGASTAGKVQVHTTPLQYCDNAATPALQYAAYSSPTGVATSATALAANGTNCSAGQFPSGVDASGNSESCTALPTTITGTAGQIVASASTGAITLSGRTCNTQMYVSPNGSDSVPVVTGATPAIGTAGLVRCSRVTPSCTLTATGLYWRVSTGAASQTCAVAIYNSAGSTQITTSPENTACATNSQNRSATGLTAFTLTEGTEYLVCAANSGTTITYLGSATGMGNFGGTNSVIDGQNAAANKYQANADCTGSTTPYACCTGSGTGTCTGMPASLGTITAAASSTFAYVAAQ